MRIALFGATGTSGGELLEQALDAGHEVRVLARTPAKIRRMDSALTVIAGDVKDRSVVAKTIAGTSAVISALGGFADTDSISVGTANIVAAMPAAGLTRLVIVQGFHLDFPGDPRNIGRKAILPLLWMGSRTLIRDSREMARAIHDSNLDWTLVRVPRITRGAPTNTVRIGHLRLGPFSSVSNGDIAQFVLTALTDPATFATAPMIANAGRHALGAAGYWVLGRRPDPPTQLRPAGRRLDQ